MKLAKASQEGTESRTAKCGTERPASHEQLMKEVCERENCWQAYKRVKANKGNPGIDGVKVGEESGRPLPLCRFSVVLFCGYFLAWA